MIATIATEVDQHGTDITVKALVADGVEVGSRTIDLCEWASQPDEYALIVAREYLSALAEVGPMTSEGWTVSW
jgi:hypothetical protein